MAEQLRSQAQLSHFMALTHDTYAMNLCDSICCSPYTLFYSAYSSVVLVLCNVSAAVEDCLDSVYDIIRGSEVRAIASSSLRGRHRDCDVQRFELSDSVADKHTIGERLYIFFFKQKTAYEITR